VKELCKELWGTETPTVLDAFAGGGSIPFEAARYGLDVLASDLNPVAVVTMKAAMEYPLKFGSDLQIDIDKWVKWVGDQAEKRLAEFFPSQPGETVQNYLWAHTVTCPSCQSTVPLSPNWWVDRSPGSDKKGKWAAVRPIPNPAQKRVDFELVVGSKGNGMTIKADDGDYDPELATTLKRGVGKCPNCETIITGDIIKSQGSNLELGHQLYAVSYRTHLRSFQVGANLFTISLMKQSLSLAFERSKVCSKFFTKLLHLSTQAFDLSMTHRIATGTKPDCPFASFSAFEGLAESSN
jgi:putative DNA methylase